MKKTKGMICLHGLCRNVSIDDTSFCEQHTRTNKKVAGIIKSSSKRSIESTNSLKSRKVCYPIVESPLSKLPQHKSAFAKYKLHRPPMINTDLPSK